MTTLLSNNKELVRQALETWATTEEGVFGILDENLRRTIVGSTPPGQTFHACAAFLEGGFGPIAARFAGADGTMLPATQDEPEKTMTNPAHPYVGLWATVDGRIRHELLPNGRYDEARGTRESAYRGRYAVTGSHIDYWDDTGFTADGDFVDADTLRHGGMVLRRRPRT